MQNKAEEKNKADGMNIYEKIGLKSYRGNYFRCFLLFVVLLITYWFVSSQWTLHVEREKMLAYLQEKYGKKFVITDINSYRKGLGLKLEVHADAHPVDDEKFIFGVNGYLEDNLRGAKYYSDGYLARLWDRQAQKQVREYFDAHGIDIQKFYISIVMPLIPPDIYGEIRGTPELTEILKKHNNIEFLLSLAEDGAFNDETKFKYAERVMNIIGFFKENSYIEDPKLSYGVRTGYKNGKVSERYSCELSSEQVRRISKPEEIVPLFKRQNY